MAVMIHITAGGVHLPPSICMPSRASCPGCLQQAPPPSCLHSNFLAPLPVPKTQGKFDIPKVQNFAYLVTGKNKTLISFPEKYIDTKILLSYSKSCV